VDLSVSRKVTERFFLAGNQNTIIKVITIRYYVSIYRVFRAQAEWTLILLSELSAEELRHLPSKIPPPGTTH
jgi:hypothetical protein